MKTSYLISIIILISVLVLACGKDKAENPNVRVFPPELVGTWNYQSATVNGESRVLRTILDWQEETVRAALIISRNGTFIYREYSDTDSITYFEDGSISVNNDDFVITIYNNSNGVVSPPASTSGTYAVNGNQLTLSLNINEIIVSIIAAKQ